jgi:ribosomal protein S18 acetylase RimI-like enzyme
MMISDAMNIRPATTDDLAAVKACAEQAYALYVPRMGRNPAPMVADFGAQISAGHVHVIEVDGAVAGFIVLYLRGDHIHVENVAILPAVQGRGIGKALLAFAEGEAKRRGLAALELYTNAKMTENQTFYPRLGYTETGRHEEDGFARVFYRKDL